LDNIAVCISSKPDQPTLQLFLTATPYRKYRSIPPNRLVPKALLNLARYRAEYCPDSPGCLYPNGERSQSVGTAYKTLLKRVGIEDFLAGEFLGHRLQFTQPGHRRSRQRVVGQKVGVVQLES